MSAVELLTVSKRAMNILDTALSRMDREQGCILGCSERLDRIDCVMPIRAAEASKFFYRPDVTQANCMIRQWAEEGVCFCGFIHSHVTEKRGLSEADMLFAESMFKSFCMPVMWFGLAVLQEKQKDYFFYLMKERQGNPVIESVDWRIDQE